MKRAWLCLALSACNPPSNAVDLGAMPRVACAAPTVTLGVDINALANNTVASPRLASSGAEAVLVWADVTSTGGFTVRLQRMNTTGAAAGAPLTIGNGSGGAPRIALATDGNQYLAAWENTTQITTATIPVQRGMATPGTSFMGASPSLAFGPAEFVLAWRDTLGVRLQRFSNAGQPLGTSTLVALASGAVPSLTATKSGYAVTFTIGTTAAWKLYRADQTLTVGANPTILTGTTGATLVALGASDDNVGAVWVQTGATAQVSALVVNAAGTPTGITRLDNMSALFAGQVAATGASASFAFVWSDGAGFAGYRAVQTSGAAQGSAQQPLATNFNDNQLDIAAVADGFLVAATADSTLDKISLAHLTCP
jgi:hypothetical protein